MGAEQSRKQRWGLRGGVEGRGQAGSGVLGRALDHGLVIQSLSRGLEGSAQKFTPVVLFFKDLCTPVRGSLGANQHPAGQGRPHVEAPSGQCACGAGK